jgi:Flp pilus assembly protein TadD
MYQWRVYVRTPAGKQDADEAAFSVPDTATAQRIREEVAATRALMSDESSINLPLVSLYVARQLYTPAEAVLQQALTLAPEDAELYRLLAHIYSLARRSQARTEVLKKVPSAVVSHD